MRSPLPRAGQMHKQNTTKTAHIIVPDSWWVVTYQGRVCLIKDTDLYQDSTHRYRRNGWSSPVTAQTQATKLNQLFQTTDFGILQIQGNDRG